MLIATNLNLNQNQLLSPVLHNLTSDPSGVEGQLYVNTSSHLIRAYLNGSWTTLSTAGGTLTGSSTANYAPYWTGTNALGGVSVTSGFLGYNSSGVPSAVSSTVVGAALVAQATATPIFGTVILTQPASAATITIASGTTFSTAGNLAFAGAYTSTLTFTAGTTVTFPTSGTLVGSADTGTVTNTMLAGSIANNKLLNSSLTIGTTSVALGATQASFAGIANLTFIAGTTTVAPINLVSGVVLSTPVAGAFEFVTDTLSFTISTGTARKTIAFTDSAMTGSYTGSVITGQYGGTGVANTGKTITLGGNLTTTGAFNTSFTQQASLTLTLPSTAGTLVGSGDTGTVTNTMLAGSIANNKLLNSSVTYGTTTVALGASSTAIAGLTNTTFVAGTLTVAPITLVAGTGTLTTPVAGNILWNGTNLFIYDSGPTLRTFAFTNTAISNLSGAAWSIPYQSATDTTSMLTYGSTLAGRALLSGNNSAPTWTAGTLSIASGGSLSVPAAAVSFGGAFSTSTTVSITGAVSIANGLSTTGTFSSGGNFSTSAAFSTVGSGTLTLTNGSTNSNLTLPNVAAANLTYNTAQPGANNQLAYAATTTAALSYITAPAVLSVLTQSSNAAAPAWTTATGTGSPVMGTDPTMSFSASNKLTLNFTPAIGADAVNKTYVDALAQGMMIKPTAKIVTTSALPANTYANGTAGLNATLTGTANGPLPTINGYTPVLNDYILVTGEATQANNGLYKLTQLGVGGSTPYILTRDTTMDTALEYSGGLIAIETTDTTYPSSLWLCTTVAAITVGSTAITFTQMNKPTDWTIGTGLTLTGTLNQTLAVNAATFNQYGLFYAGSTTQFAQVSAPGSNNLALVGATAAGPSWSTLVITPTGGANATISIAAGKTLTISNSLTLAGTDGTTITFPGATGTLAYYISGNAPTAANQVAYTVGAASGSQAYTTVNSTATNMFLRQVSSGAPTFAALTASDITTALAFTPIKKFVTTITGSGPTWTITGATHGITNQNLIVKIYDANLSSANCTQEVYADVAINYSTYTITLTMGYGVPAAGTYTVIIIG